MNKIKVDLNNYKNYTFDFNNREIYKNYEFSEQVIEKHQDKWDWGYIAIFQSLTEPFIEKFKDKWNDWDCIAINQSLTESFIEKFKDKWNWDYIAKYQTLSESFIEKFKDKWDWDYIVGYQSLSEPFRNKYLNEDQKKFYKEFHPNEKENNNTILNNSINSNKYSSHCYICGSETIIWDIGFGNSNQRICPRCKE